MAPPEFLAPPGGPEDASSPVSAKCMEGGGLGRSSREERNPWENPLENGEHHWTMGESGDIIGKSWSKNV